LNDSLSDIEQDALSVAVRIGLSDLDHEREQIYTTKTAWSERLAFWQGRGIAYLRRGLVIRQARSLALSPGVSRGLAALSMARGGVRVAQIVFCAAHFPGGVESRWRFACMECDPDAASIYPDGHIDGRDVITMEGGPRL
jgi:hypothetical protein